MKHLKLAGLVAAASMVLSGAAMAGPSWTYVRLGLQASDDGIEGEIRDGTGWVLEGSFGFASIWHVQALYGASENKETECTSCTKFETIRYGLNLGLNPHITDSTDLFLQLNVGNEELDKPPSSSGKKTDENFVAVTAGIRTMISDNFEFNFQARLGQTDFGEQICKDNGGSDCDSISDRFSSARAGFLYNFTQNFGIDAFYAWDSNSVSTAEIGARFSF